MALSIRSHLLVRRKTRTTADEAGCDDQSHAHRHDPNRSDIDTFSIELEKPVAPEEFNEFLQELAIEFGENLLRMKGILNVRNSDQPAIVHGVQHVFFPITWLDEWPSAERNSKLVFITQGLPRETIQSRFDEGFG